MSVKTVLLPGPDPVANFLTNLNPVIGNFWTPKEIKTVSTNLSDIGEKFSSIGSDINVILENALAEPFQRVVKNITDRNHDDHRDHDNKRC